MPDTNYWIWIFGEIKRFRGVLELRTMAFSKGSWSRVSAMGPGDRAILYVTRSAFHNPTRDRSRLAGIAEVVSKPNRDESLEIADKVFDVTVGFKPAIVLPERCGPEMADLVKKLEYVKNPDVWGVYFRNSPIKITRQDYRVLEQAIRAWSQVEEAKE